MKKLFLFLLPFYLLADTCCDESPIDPCEFAHAQEMFNPWYSGPLLTGSAHMMKPGDIGIQPYLITRVNYGHYNRQHHSNSFPHNLVQYQPMINALQAGVTSWLDASLAIQGQVNTQDGRMSGGFGDLIATVGLKLLEETVSAPAIKIGVGEIFPTGRYQHFSANKWNLGATGQGSYQTLFSLRIAKMFLRSGDLPMNIRATVEYVLPNHDVHVSGFNAYGGGHGTSGTVRLGQQFNATVGFECCFYEKCVLVADVVYVYNEKSRFSGTAGVNADGTSAVNGLPSSYSWSLAPVLEYNWSRNFGVLVGMWFTFYGRNTDNFLGPVAGLNYVFPVH